MNRWKTPVVKKWKNHYFNCPLQMHYNPPHLCWRNYISDGLDYNSPEEFLLAMVEAGEEMYIDIFNAVTFAKMGVDQ